MLKSGEYWKQHWHKLRFSAAAAAAHFLSSLSPTNRQHTRKIVVHEDHFSVARPECHAQGLVPFCQENPALRIERQANLWKTIFMPQLGVNSNPPSSYPLLDGTYGYRAHGLITQVATWVSEASSPLILQVITLLLTPAPYPNRLPESSKTLCITSLAGDRHSFGHAN